MSAPDIAPGDFIRAYADSGVRRGEQLLRRSLILEVLAVGDPPGRPGWRYVSGRICRQDLTLASRSQHTAIQVTGTERSIINLTGQWQLLLRP